MQISKKKIFKTAILPGIYPRLKLLLGSGFANFAFLIALVYNTVRILPNNHKFLKSEAKGTYSIRNVIAEASNHIHFSLKNIDQIIIFFCVIAAFFILIFQFLILLFAVLIPQANAQEIMPTTIGGFFNTPNPQEDIAFRMLDLVFGIPDIFGSKDFAETNVHTALHSLFEFYSYGMLLVGIIIIIYYIIAVVAETAQSGIPFGQRFNKAWAPIRVILFFALLIPLSHGINGGQYITLGAAKLGSGLATTGWLAYNDKITTTLTGDVESNIAEPTAPDITHIPAFMLLAKTCQKGYHTAVFVKNDVSPSDIPTNHIPTNDEDSTTGIRAWVVYQKKESAGGGYGSILMRDTTFQNITALTRASSFQVVFGVRDPVSYPNEQANISSICGKLSFAITDLNEPGSAAIHTDYYNLILETWNGAQDVDLYAQSYVDRSLPDRENRDLDAPLPTHTYKQEWVKYIDDYIGGTNGTISKAVEAQIAGGDWQLSGQIRDYGWGGAGIWYNKIAIQNGALVTAMQKSPTIISYPEVMQRFQEHVQRETEEISGMAPLPGGMNRQVPAMPSKFTGEKDVLNVLQEVYAYWQNTEDRNDLFLTQNPIIDSINLLLGTGGLFKMCENASVHPLAQLSSVGKTMIESAIRSYVAAGILTVANIIPNPFSGAAGSFASMFSSVATVGLLVGFILFYVLPFMPFLYFFFAVGGWVKGIFEAMVAMPLWALAHLRIDGDGIPGEAAIGGYYLIFEIFIRPILIVFGLLASITIFAAMVRVLNDIFYLAISNISGHETNDGISCFLSPEQDLSGAGSDEVREKIRDARADSIQQARRGPIDEFFFTVLYAIVVYMIGTTCFKLIDLIPNNILRWINAEVPSFNDSRDDPAEGLVKYIALAGGQLGGGLSQSIGGVATGAQQSVTSALGLIR